MPLRGACLRASSRRPAADERRTPARGRLSGDASPLAGACVLQIIPELDAGGAERTTVESPPAWLRPARARWWPPRAAAWSASCRPRAASACPSRRRRRTRSMALNVGRLARLCRREGVQIIHARSRAPAWVALGAARRLKLPFVTTYHGSYSGRTAVKVLYNSVMARGDVVIANSHYTADLIRRLHPEQAGDRVRVIHRGTDLSAFTPVAVGSARVEALRRSLGRRAPRAHRSAGGAPDRLERPAHPDRGRGADARPGCRRFRRRARRRPLRAGGLRARARCAGDGARARRRGPSGRTLRRLPAAFRAASVVAVPSVEPEAFGRSAVEAQALGTPVVVSDLGAVPETVLSPPEVFARAAHGLAGAGR